MLRFSVAKIRSHLVRSFSLRECLAWAFAPLFLLYLVAAILGSSALSIFFPLLPILGIYVILCSFTFYALTFFWTNHFYRSVLMTAALSFVIFGHVGATVLSAQEFEADREIETYRSLTSQETAKRNRYYQNVLMTLGPPSALVGGVIALLCQVFIRLHRSHS
jgi:hypothetical protein